MEPARFMQMAAMMQGGSAGEANNFTDPGSVMGALQDRGLPDLPMPKFGNPDDVRKEALSRSTDIFKHSHTLRNVLDRHEATIQKRWLKKGKEQRRKAIVDAWGRMAR